MSDEAQILEQGQQDIDDIAKLQNFPSFTRYFLRRLRMKYAALEKRLKDDPPDKCDAAEREIVRRIMIEIVAIEGMMDADMRIAQGDVTRLGLKLARPQHPQSAGPPPQHGARGHG